MFGSHLQLFPSRQFPHHNVTKFLHVDGGVGIGLVDNESEGVVSNAALQKRKVVTFHQHLFFFEQRTCGNGETNTIFEQQANG